MRFFFPPITDAEQAERFYSEVRALAMKKSSYPLTDRRIYSLRFLEEGRQEASATVGRLYRGETVIAIFESSEPYYVCTHDRGVRYGDPYLVGPHQVTSVEEFEHS